MVQIWWVSGPQVLKFHRYVFWICFVWHFSLLVLSCCKIHRMSLNCQDASKLSGCFVNTRLDSWWCSLLFSVTWYQIYQKPQSLFSPCPSWRISVCLDIFIEQKWHLCCPSCHEAVLQRSLPLYTLDLSHWSRWATLHWWNHDSSGGDCSGACWALLNVLKLSLQVNLSPWGSWWFQVQQLFEWVIHTYCSFLNN